MIEHAIQSLVASDSAVIGFVGDRIYYMTAPQDVSFPYIVIFKVSSTREHCHEGFSNLTHSRIQFSIFSETYYNGKQIADAIKDVLDGYKGTSESTSIHSSLFDGESDGYETETFYITLDFMVWHEEN
jgi:hypothetical protein